MCLSFVLLKRQKSRLLYILFHLNGFHIYVLYFESALLNSALWLHCMQK